MEKKELKLKSFLFSTGNTDGAAHCVAIRQHGAEVNTTTKDQYK